MSNGGLISGAFSSSSGKADIVMDTNGQILYFNNGRKALDKEDNDDVLTLKSGLPSWEPISAGATVTVSRDELSADETVTGDTFADTSLAITCQASGKFIVANQILAKSDSATDQMIFRCVDGDTEKGATGASSPYNNGYHGVTSLPLTGTCDSQVIKVQFRSETTGHVTLKGVTPFFSAMVMFEVS